MEKPRFKTVALFFSAFFLLFAALAVRPLSSAKADAEEKLALLAAALEEDDYESAAEHYYEIKYTSVRSRGGRLISAYREEKVSTSLALGQYSDAFSQAQFFGEAERIEQFRAQLEGLYESLENPLEKRLVSMYLYLFVANAKGEEAAREKYAAQPPLLAAGDGFCLYVRGGSVAALGDCPFALPLWEGVTAVSAGPDYAVAVSGGSDSPEYVSAGRKDALRTFVGAFKVPHSVSCSETHSALLLRSMGCAVTNRQDTAELTRLAQVAAGDVFTAGLTRRGTVVVTGDDALKEAAKGLKNIVSIAAGGGTLYALDTSGRVWSSKNGEVLEGAVEISAAGGGLLALRGDGSVLSLGYGEEVAAALASAADVTGICAGFGCAAVESGGKIMLITEKGIFYE